MTSHKLGSALFTISLAAAVGVCPGMAAAAQMSQPPPQVSEGAPPAPDSAPLPPEQMQQLVAPIALYPDTLVAQILAAASYPTQIVEAERYLVQNPGLSGEALANAVNEQSWAPSVKALTAFPQVLSDMSQNLSWTAELGDVNDSQPEDLMNAIQSLRQQAQQAGTLQSNAQETVDDQGSYIGIAPTDPEQVYVPDYDPEYVYGQPVGLWPGFYPWWTAGGAYISFGLGIPMQPWYGYGWGWRHWRLGWGAHPGVWYGHDRWHSRPHDYYDHRQFERGEYRGYGGREGRHGFEHGRGNSYTHARPGMPSGVPGDYRVGPGGDRQSYGHAAPGMHSGAAGGVTLQGQPGPGMPRGGGGFHGAGHGGGYGGGHGGSGGGGGHAGGGHR